MTIFFIRSRFFLYDRIIYLYDDDLFYLTMFVGDIYLKNEYKLYISQNPRNSTSIRYTRYIKKLLVSIEHYKKTIEKNEKKNKYNFFVATFKIYINYCLRILQKRDIDMYNKCLSMLHKINAVISLTFLNNKNIGTCAEILYFQLRHIMSINV